MSNQSGLDSSQTAGILPLLSGEGDRRLLLQWIDSQDEYELVDPSQPLETAEFDCCIIDGESLKKHAKALKERKREADPVLLPCLLLLPEADISVIDVDRGEIADTVIFETVDEVVSMPIKKAELKWRTRALLRLRSQSLSLDRQRRELRLFKQAAESAGHAIYIVDESGTIEYVNPAFEKITGYTEAMAVGETPGILSSGEEPDSYYEDLWTTLSAGDMWQEEIVNKRQNGELYHASQTIAPVLSETGSPKKFVAIQSETTERVKATEQLEQFRDIVERLEDPIMLQDKQGRFVLGNKALTEYADMSRDDLRGKTEAVFMDPESATYIAKQKRKAIEEERPVSYSISPTFPQEDSEIFSTSRYPYYGPDGDIEGTLAICRVVTDLNSRNDQLEVLDRVLRHNLRNDMTTIGMFAEKLQAEVPSELTDDVNRIQTTAQRINRMVEKQRKVTQFLIETPDTQDLDLSELVEMVANRHRSDYPSATIKVETPGTCSVETIPALEQAVSELIENAIIHSDTEHPTVHVQVLENGAGCRIRIADNGPGIPEMDQQVLTGNIRNEQLYHGSGLGLWFVHLVVEYAGGAISVEQNEPRGSQICITF